MQGSMDLLQLIRLLLRKLWFIILISAVGLLISFGYTKLLVIPKYTSSVKLYVSNTKIIEPQEKINYNDIYASKQLVNTYIVIIQSNKVLNKVIESENLQCTANYLRKLLKVKSLSETEVMEVFVTTEDPRISADIANAIARIAPDAIKEITKAGAVGVVDEAYPSMNPSSPNILTNSAVGLLLGIFISVLYIIVMEMLDIRIKGEEDIKRHYKIPVLGSIPVLHSRMKGGYTYYEQK